jgi:hypothetical protein
MPARRSFLIFGFERALMMLARTHSTPSTLNIPHCAFHLREPYTVAHDTYRFIVEILDSSTGGVAAA